MFGIFEGFIIALNYADICKTDCLGLSDKGCYQKFVWREGKYEQNESLKDAVLRMNFE